MFPSRSKRIAAAGMLMGALAVGEAAPARAAGWGEIRDWAEDLRPRALAWLGLAQEPAVLKDCSHIDPDGHCVKGGRRGRGPALSGRDGHLRPGGQP